MATMVNRVLETKRERIIATLLAGAGSALLCSAGRILAFWLQNLVLCSSGRCFITGNFSADWIPYSKAAAR